MISPYDYKVLYAQRCGQEGNIKLQYENNTYFFTDKEGRYNTEPGVIVPDYILNQPESYDADDFVSWDPDEYDPVYIKMIHSTRIFEHPWPGHNPPNRRYIHNFWLRFTDEERDLLQRLLEVSDTGLTLIPGPTFDRFKDDKWEVLYTDAIVRISDAINYAELISSGQFTQEDVDLFDSLYEIAMDKRRGAALQ
jgi:hypothetical protein